MSKTFSNRAAKVIPAGIGKSAVFKGVFSKIFVEDASAPFDLQLDDGGINQALIGFKANFLPDTFRSVTVFNQSATEPLYVTLWRGNASVEFPTLIERRQIAVPWDVSLAADGTMDFPGIATGSAPYSTFGVAAGSRRRDILITLKASFSGSVRLIETTSQKAIAIISASSGGGGLIKDTPCKLTLVNKSGGAIDNTASFPGAIDIAVCEFFVA